jgi:segregation and condensation protein B
MEISRQIESILFYRGEPTNVITLSKILNVSHEDILQGLEILKNDLTGRGIILMQNGSEYMLGTAPEMGPVIESILRDELGKEIGKAGLETLSIVLYRGPIGRSEINYLRGVNSNYILRSLLVRGLIERVDQGGRTVVYQPTFELLSYLGVKNVSELPEYENTRKSVLEFESTNKENENDEEK